MLSYLTAGVIRKSLELVLDVEIWMTGLGR